jgi:hypothetical protein
VEDGKPDEPRQLDDAGIGKEFGEIAAHGLRRRRRRRAEVDEKNAFQRINGVRENYR